MNTLLDTPTTYAVTPAPDNSCPAEGRMEYLVKGSDGLCATVYHRLGGMAPEWDVVPQNGAAALPGYSAARMVRAVKEWEGAE